MKIKPVIDGQCILVPSASVMKALPEANGTKLKVLLSVLAEPEADDAQLCERLDITLKTLNSSVEYWVRQGVIENENRIPQKTTAAHEVTKAAENVTVQRRAIMRESSLPSYTSEEVADFIEANKGVSKLINDCQQCMGKMFNKTEVETIVGLLDYLKLDTDYILLLFTYCERIDKKSIRYVEKLAIELFDRGIMKYKELDAHLMTMESARQMNKPLRELFGVGHRAFTKKEKAYVENWTKWGMPFEVIEKAYEITVENTGNASFAYCNGVLENWHGKGYVTLEEIEKSIEQYKLDKEGAKDKKGSFDTDDFWEAALRRTYGDTQNN